MSEHTDKWDWNMYAHSHEWMSGLMETCMACEECDKWECRWRKVDTVLAYAMTMSTHEAACMGNHLLLLAV